MLYHNNRHTDEDEGQGDAEGEDVATEGLVVLAVALCEHAQAGIDVVFTQSLWKLKAAVKLLCKIMKTDARHTACPLNRTQIRTRHYKQRLRRGTHLEDFGGADERGQGRGQGGREDPGCDDGTKA